MARKRRDVTEAELDVLRVLWDRGASTIRELTDRLYPDGGVAHYATVQKLLERLAAKRCVRRQASARAHVYRATVDREALIAQRLADTADALCEGSLTPLLTHLVGRVDLSAAELRALRAKIEGRPRTPRSDR